MESWFSRGLQRWYGENKRDLPWRKETDPYKIWLSEIILQQTQVAQGLSYYLRFIENYPTVSHLAKAKEDKVLKDWQGLGYYSRARNLQVAAKDIIENRKGKFPATYSELKSLKGVGDYTAAAIASFAYNQPHAVVDGNVYRVLSRIFHVETPIDSTSGKKEFAELAESLLDLKNPGIHNQSIMEFGSQYCKPVKPDCENCIFRSKCLAFKNKTVNSLPVKAKKTKVTNRYLNYLVLIDADKKIVVNKRSGDDIWKGLYEFPLIETVNEIEEKKLFKLPEFKNLVSENFSLLHYSKDYKHVLSHQHLYAKFYVVRTKNAAKKVTGSYSLKNMEKLAFPRLIEKFLNDCKLTEIV